MRVLRHATAKTVSFLRCFELASVTKEALENYLPDCVRQTLNLSSFALWIPPPFFVLVLETFDNAQEHEKGECDPYIDHTDLNLPPSVVWWQHFQWMITFPLLQCFVWNRCRKCVFLLYSARAGLAKCFAKHFKNTCRIFCARLKGPVTEVTRASLRTQRAPDMRSFNVRSSARCSPQHIPRSPTKGVVNGWPAKLICPHEGDGN